MQEINTQSTSTQVIELIERSGLRGLFGVQTGQSLTRTGKKEQLIFQGLEKTVVLDPDNGLDRLLLDSRFLLNKLISLVPIPPRLKMDCGSTDLLQEQLFARSCLSEVNAGVFPLQGNSLLCALGQLDPRVIPVAYGSTAGINFAEVLETALVAQEASKKLAQETVILFDYDGQPSTISRTIFGGSLVSLPPRLRERAINFRAATGADLMAGRIRATRDLLIKIEGLPEVVLVDLLDYFRSLGERFSVGQLLALAKIAGSDPILFHTSVRELRTNMILGDINGRSGLFDNGINALSTPVSALIDQHNLRPGGLTCYALQTMIARENGVVVLPFKLTPNANIYKILQSTGVLFDGDKQNGAILAPISRLRIKSRGSNQPIDPVALAVLALDQPTNFQTLVSDIKAGFRVLQPEQAIQKGVGDVPFLIESYFNLQEEDE